MQIIICFTEQGFFQFLHWIYKGISCSASAVADILFISIKIPFFQRVSELQKQVQDVYGKSGFWEEFEVCVCVGGVGLGR